MEARLLRCKLLGKKQQYSDCERETAALCEQLESLVNSVQSSVQQSTSVSDRAAFHNGLATAYELRGKAQLAQNRASDAMINIGKAIQLLNGLYAFAKAVLDCSTRIMAAVYLEPIKNEL